MPLGDSAREGPVHAGLLHAPPGCRVAGTIFLHDMVSCVCTAWTLASGCMGDDSFIYPHGPHKEMLFGLWKSDE